MKALSNTSYEFSLTTETDEQGVLDILQNILLSHGVAYEEIVLQKDVFDVAATCYFSSRKEAASLQSRIKKQKLKDIKVTYRKINKSDWINRWKKNLNAFSLTATIDVVPLWKANSYRRKSRKIIYIDTVSAFGTGMHETTRFMAQLIESRAGHFKTVFDIGAGTGILSMVAAQHGAEHLDAIDISDTAVSTAQDNLAKNGLSFDMIQNVDFQNFKANMQYDLVAANLITHDLLDFRDKIVKLVKKGQYLAISGISKKNISRVREAYKKSPLRCLRVVEGESWGAILYKRN